jgi:two-component response regulator involved in C4-dicarboxylate transport
MATRTIRPELAPWIRFADALARMQGPSTEIVLHDLTNPAHSVVYVVNGDITDRKVGQGVRHLVPEMLTSHEGKPIGPWWFRYRTKLIRATTELIYDKAGEIIGALCVNEDVTGEERLFLSLEGRLPGLTMTDLKADGDTAGLIKPETSVKDAELSGKPDSVRKTVFRLISETAAQKAYAEAKTNRDVRRRLVRDLKERDVFLLKGSIEELARLLGLSKVTIYSDLDALRHI